MSSWGLSWLKSWGLSWGPTGTVPHIGNPKDINLNFYLSRPQAITDAPDDLPLERKVGFMTVREAFMELWDLSGHASDMYPFAGDSQIESELDPTTEGSQYFFRLLTQGQVALANWKKTDFRFLRFRQFYKHFNIQLGVNQDTTYTITRETAEQFYLDPTQTGFDFNIDMLTSSLIVIDGSEYKIMTILEVSPTNWTFYLQDTVTEEAVPSYPEVITDVTFAINEFNVVSSPNPQTNTFELTIPEDTYTIYRIDDYVANKEVLKTRDVDELSTKGEAFSVGTPSHYLYIGDKVIFNTALAEKRWYKVEIFRNPGALADLDQSFEIPAPYHQALIFWCMWKISIRERNEINSMNFRRLIDRELESVRDEYDQLFERTKSMGVKIRRD